MRMRWSSIRAAAAEAGLTKGVISTVVAITGTIALTWNITKNLYDMEVTRITAQKAEEVTRITGEAKAEVARITGEAKGEAARHKDKEDNCRFYVKVFGTHDHEPTAAALARAMAMGGSAEKASK